MRLCSTAPRIGLILGLVSLTAAGCSGSQADEEELTAEPSEPPSAPEPEAAPAVAEPAPEPVAEAASPAVAPTPVAAVEPGRVVRFVGADEAPIVQAPQDGAAAVGKLLKGDMVLVVEENGWGRIADGMFIRLDGLSAKAVPRNRQPAAWIAPTH